MRHLCKKIFSLFIILCCVAITRADNSLFGKTFFEQRSQGQNLARWEAGQYHHLYLYNTDCINGSLSITPYFSQIFNEREIGQWFFFNESNTMRFGAANAPGVDVFARNFFLNDDFNGFVTANPRVRNLLVDINFYLGLDEWVRGLYFRIDVPVAWTSWDMRLTDSIDQIGTTIAMGALGNNTAALPSPLSSIIQAWKGQTLDTANFPDLKQKMIFATIDGKQTEVGVADISFILGYNFINNECAHFGLQAWVIAPTGTRPDAQFAFEPIVGNGRHVAVGGGITGHYELWNNGTDQSFGLLVEGYAVHLFKARQKRTFDLKQNGPGSRYLLIKRFNPGDMTYAGEILFGPNVLTRDIKVQNDVTGEAILMFDYQNGGFTFDVGYNIWGRTRDRIEIVDPIPASTFGIQGATDTILGSTTVNATQSQSTISGMFAPPAETPPVFIKTDDLDINSAAHPGALSHKIFTHFAYTWENCDYLPFIGIGGAVEFSGRENRAFDQWAVWAKGGFTFS